MADFTSPKPLIRRSNRNCLHCSLRPKTPVVGAASGFLEAMNVVKQEVQWPAKQLLHAKQLPANQVLVIQQGFVGISGAGSEEEGRMLGVAGPGQVLFVEQLMPGFPAFGSMRTLTRLYGCLLPVQLLHAADGLRRESLCFFEQSTLFYQQSLLRMQQLAQANVLQRMVLSIDHVLQAGGFSAKGELLLPLRRSDWASLAQITTESAIRAMAKLEARGFIEKKGRMLRLLPAFQPIYLLDDLK